MIVKLEKVRFSVDELVISQSLFLFVNKCMRNGVI